jgi:hypothetical protein
MYLLGMKFFYLRGIEIKFENQKQEVFLGSDILFFYQVSHDARHGNIKSRMT